MKMKDSLIVAALALAAGFGASAQTSTWTIDPAHSSAQFSILHMGVSHVHGSLTGIKGTVEYNEKEIGKSSVTAVIDTTTVTTSNEMRDKDLKSPNFFDVAKYPTMTFKSTAVTRTNGKLQMTGELTLNGVTKPVTLEIEGPMPPQKGMGGKMVSGFSATGSIKRSEFNFGSKMGSPMLGDEVQITIDIEIGKPA